MSIQNCIIGDDLLYLTRREQSELGAICAELLRLEIGVRAKINQVDLEASAIGEQELRTIISALPNLDDINFEEADFLGGSAWMYNLLPSRLSKLDLTATKIDPRDLGKLYRLYHLHHLDLSSISGLALYGGWMCQLPPNLQGLEIDDTQVPVSDLRGLKWPTLDLRCIDFGGNDLDPDEIPQPHNWFPELTRLELNSTVAGVDGIWLDKFFALLPRLTRLNASGSWGIANEASGRWIAQLRSLQECDLSGIGDISAGCIEGLARLPSLKYLDVCGTGDSISDDTMPIFEREFPGLQELKLGSTLVSEAACRRLEAIRPNLRIRR